MRVLGPNPGRLVRNDDAPLSQTVFDNPQTQRKFELQPNRLSDHVWRKTMAAIPRKSANCHADIRTGFGNIPAEMKEGLARLSKWLVAKY